MIIFKSLVLEGLPFFKHRTEFNLDQKGISLVLGRNLDSSTRNSNGAGKSLFFGQLPEVLIGEPSIGIKRDISRKGVTEFTFQKGEHEYLAKRAFKGSEKLHIYRDGKDLEYRELKAAREALGELLPFNSAEITSLMYLDSRVPHPLIRGSSAERERFFKRFFRMNSAPALRKIVKSELDAISSKTGAYKVMVGRRKDIKERLVDKSLEDLIAERDKLTRRVTKVEALSKQYAIVNRVVEDYADHKKEFLRFATFGINTWKAAQAEADRVETQIGELAEQIAQWKRYEEWIENQQELVARKKEWEKEWKDVSSRYRGMPLSAVKEEIAKFEAGLEEIEGLVAKAKSKLSDIPELDDLNRKINVTKQTITDLEAASDKCPTCGGEYTDKHAKKELSLAKERLAELRDLKVLSVEKRDKQEVNLTNYSISKKFHDESLADAKKARRLLAEEKSWEEGESVKEPETSKEVLVSKRVKRKAYYQSLIESKAVFAAAAAYKDLTDEDKELAKGDSPTDKLIQLHERLGEIKMQVEEVQSLTEELATLVADIRKIKTEIDEKEVLEVLYEALSKKGVESQMIKLVCDRLEQQVNKYARLLFPENFNFRFEMETQFNIVVERKYGKKMEPSDVRKLSGAESLLFSLILLIALLSFVPPKNRTNILILDEPTATFSPEMIDSFVKFLPVLNTVIPHVIVVTPMPNQEYPGAKVYTVVKKGGVSTIIEGTDVSKVKTTKKVKVKDDRKRARSASA